MSLRPALARLARRLADRLDPPLQPPPPMFEAQLSGMPRIDGLRLRVAEGSRCIVIPEVKNCGILPVPVTAQAIPPETKPVEVLRHLFVRREPVVFDYAGVEQKR